MYLSHRFISNTFVKYLIYLLIKHRHVQFLPRTGCPKITVPNLSHVSLRSNVSKKEKRFIQNQLFFIHLILVIRGISLIQYFLDTLYIHIYVLMVLILTSIKWDVRFIYNDFNFVRYYQILEIYFILYIVDKSLLIINNNNNNNDNVKRKERREKRDKIDNFS